jgi:glutamate dehydrogenase
VRAEARADGRTAGAEAPSPSIEVAALRARFSADRGSKPHEVRAHGSTANSFFVGVKHHMKDAIRRAGLDAAEERRLLTPERTTAVRFPVEMDNGKPRFFSGWRIIHSTRRGPGKGGIRFARGLGRQTVAGLAFEMPDKSSIYGLPLGGAKGGVDVHPDSLSTGELTRVMRGYVRAVLDAEWEHGRIAFGPEIDVPAPDVGTSPPEINLMEVAADEYLYWLREHGAASVGDHPVPQQLEGIDRSRDGKATPFLDRYLELFREGVIPNLALAATFTGKSVEKGGSRGRSEATGLGVAFATLETLKHEGVLAKGSTRFTGQSVAIQGFGNVGHGAAVAFADLGARVEAISESDGKPYAIVRAGGFDLETLEAMAAYKKAHGTLRSFPGVQVIEVDAFWQRPVDVLAPCARENEIDARVASEIRARYIAEGANGPTTSEADEILEARGITVVPDIFANAAGVTVSYFEMVQNLAGESWTTPEVRAKLYDRLTQAFRSITAIRSELGLTMRDAAYVAAVLGLTNPAESSPSEAARPELRTEERIIGPGEGKLRRLWSDAKATAGLLARQ